jgi:hypothetical protein
MRRCFGRGRFLISKGFVSRGCRFTNFVVNGFAACCALRPPPTPVSRTCATNAAPSVANSTRWLLRRMADRLKDHDGQ